jgi:predicted GIY-YIG superfamily endonuclease
MNMEAKYLRMIQGMKRRGRKDWTVYILRCGDGSLYTGIAKDVQARAKQPSEGRGASYTQTRLPVKLLYRQEGLTHSKALIREAQIKAMSRSKKEEIIFNESNA